MGATQVDIARAIGIDVSSVNKILNRRKGPKFKAETVSRVFLVAKQMGYDFKKPSKGALLALMREVLPSDLTDKSIADLRNLSLSQVRRFRALLARAEGA